MARAKKRRAEKGSLTRRGATWYLRFSDPDTGKRRWVSLKTTNKATAEVEAEKILSPYTATDEAERLRRLADRARHAESVADELIAKANRISLVDAWDRFERDQTRPQSGPHTMKAYRLFWERFTHWCIKTKGTPTFIEDITDDHAAAFMLHCGKNLNLGPNRFNKTRQALSLVFTTLLPDGVASPFAKIRPRRLDAVSRRELTPDELRRIMTAADGEMRVLLSLGLFCGFRLADAAGLLWSEVDLVKGTITRMPSKTRSRTRKTLTLPIHPVLMELLSAIPKGRRRGAVCPELFETYTADGGCRLVKMIRQHFIDCGIEDAEVRAPVKGGAKIRQGDRLKAAPTATFHSLRHSMVSLLARENVPLSVVRQIVGHSSESVTRIYIHTTDAEVERAVACLPDPREITVPATETARERLLRLSENWTDDQVDAAIFAAINKDLV